MYKEYLKRKYTFLSSEDIDMLLLIAKLNLNYEEICLLKNKNNIDKFLKKYSNKLEKINYNNEIDNVRDVTDKDVNTLFYFKKNKIDINKLYEKYKSVLTFKIDYYPKTKEVIYKILKRKKIEKYACLSVLVVSALVFTISSYKLFIWQSENNKIKKISGNISNIADVTEVKESDNSSDNNIEVVSDDYFKYKDVSMLDVNFNELLKQNKDTKGWIKVEGTNVNYPFVQSSDNEYYLKHSYDNTYNKKGWVFLDYRNNMDNLDKNTILYAHGLMNNQMFGSLRRTVKQDWAKNKNNRIIKISTPNSMLLFEVFSSYTIEPESYYITSEFSGDEEFSTFIDTIKSRSFYDYNTSVSTSDKILTLSSCYDNKKRMVLHAKLIAKK